MTKKKTLRRMADRALPVPADDPKETEAHDEPEDEQPALPEEPEPEPEPEEPAAPTPISTRSAARAQRF
jgi:hypothetical protein